MTQILFLAFSAAFLALSAYLLLRHAGPRYALVFLAGSAVWLGYAVFLARRGALISPSLPPRLLLILIPMASFALWLAFGRTGAILADRIPLRTLIGLQGFRLIVELFLHRLMREDLVPRAMTFEGHNYDIFIGVSALALYAGWNRLPDPARLSRTWNLGGLAFLAVVVVTGILSVPGPLHFFNREHPNIAVTIFPYVFIPTLFVAAALGLHILALRKIAGKR